MSDHNYKRVGDVAVVSYASTGYLFEVTGTTRKFAQPSVFSAFGIGSPLRPYRVLDWDIVPNGPDNMFPQNLKYILGENELPGGILKRQKGLLWGNGPYLYKEEIESEEIKRVWVDDTEVTNWLKSWNYHEYLRRIIVDFYYSEGIFSKIIRNKGARVGLASKIVALEHVPYQDVRFEFPDDYVHPKNVIVGDWELLREYPFRSYPLFSISDPYSAPISVRYDYMYSFAERFYGTPAFLGAINWINRGSDIPKILSALTQNSLNIKWHIKSPASYWEAERERIRNECNLKGIVFNETMVEDRKDKIFNMLSDVLSGVDNVGKFFSSETVMNELGKTEEWSIESIDQKVKDFIESQILIAKQASSAITSGMGLHPSLSNIIVDGKLSSGSEQLYALKMYMASEITIPEELITQAINDCIELKWPGKKLKLGFYHQIVKTEDNVTAADRVKNKV